MQNKQHDKRSERTRENILGSAETLFLARGYKSASLREIAASAGVDIGLISYHFKSKLNLFHYVFECRLNNAFNLQLEQLALLLDRLEGEPASVEEILTAYSETTLKLYGEESRDLIAAVGLASLRAEPEISDVVIGLVKKHYEPVYISYITALKQSLPDMDEKRIVWAFDAFQSIYRSNLIEDSLNFGASSDSQVDLLRECIVPFAAAGFYNLQPSS